jgi:uncharacterized protein (DUF433 family)
MSPSEEMYVIPVSLSHIWLDEAGVAWIDDTNRKVIEIAMDYRAGTTSAEEIARAYDGLTPAQVHAALVYYLDNQNDCDAEIDRHAAEYERLRGQTLNSPGRQRVKNLGLRP